MAVFVVALEDKTSGPAETAADAVRGLSAEFDALQKELAGVEAMQAKAFAHHGKSAIKGASEGDILADIKKQQQAALAGHDQDRDAMLGRSKLLDELAQKEKTAADEANAMGSNFSEATDQLGPYLDVIGQIVEGWKKIGRAVVEAMKLAVQLTQEKNALEETFNVFTNGMGGQLLDELEDLAAELPFTADKLNAWAKSLLAAGITGDQLKTSIKAIAAATAIMGESGGAAAEGLIKRFGMAAEAGQKISLDRRILTQLASAGVSVAALAKQLGVAPEKLGEMKIGAKELGDAMQKALIAQGAGPLAALGNTWASISAKISEGFDDAFEDLDDLVGPFMAELKSLASEFFAGSVASQGFAGAVKGVLTPAFQFATGAVRWLHLAFLEIEIAVLKVRIALKPVTSALGEIGISSGLVSYALFAMKYILIGIAIIFGVLALAVAAVALPFVIAALAIYGIGKAISYVIGLIGGAIDNFDNIAAAASQAGSDIITGLGNALQSGAAWVIGIAAAVATGIIGAITGPLKISSPSRVMMTLGDYTMQGLALGIEGGQGGVEAAAQGAGMATVTGTQKGAADAGGGGQGGGRGIHLTLEEGAVQINATGDPSEVRGMVEEAFAVLLERLAAKAGL